MVANAVAAMGDIETIYIYIERFPKIGPIDTEVYCRVMALAVNR